MIDLEAQSIVTPSLAPGETLRWAARVDGAAYARAAAGHLFYAASLAVIGAMLTSAAGWLLAGGALKPGAALLPGLTLAALGVAGLTGAIHRVVVIHRGAGAVYGLTDRRVLVASRTGAMRTWMPLDRILGVQVFGDARRATITLTASPAGATTARLALALHAINRPHAVEALLLDLLSSSSPKDPAP